MSEDNTELFALRDAWRKEADDQTLETLPAFLQKLAAHKHDYNTICYAVACAAVASAKSMNRTPNGGITGFQAGAVMWEFIGHWMHLDGKHLRLTEYENMLFPQYEDRFTTISESTWKWLQEQAAKKLREKEDAHPNVAAHWQAIVNGQVPFGFTVQP